MEINRSLLKVDKSQKIGNETFGNCYIALYRNEYHVVAKDMKIIESPKKTREEVWQDVSAITGIGDQWGITLLFGVSTDGATFYLASHADVLMGSSRVPAPRSRGRNACRTPKIVCVGGYILSGSPQGPEEFRVNK